MFSRLCGWLDRALMGVCVLLLLVIVVALSVQITARYLGFAVTHSDEIAMASMTWMTFLGAAWVYRNNAHIAVDLLAGLKSRALRAGVEILNQIVILVVMGLLAWLVTEVMPLMSRLQVGTLGLTRFQLHFLPLLIGSGFVLLFAVEKLVRLPAMLREGH